MDEVYYIDSNGNKISNGGISKHMAQERQKNMTKYTTTYIDADGNQVESPP